MLWAIVVIQMLWKFVQCSVDGLAFLVPLLVWSDLWCQTKSQKVSKIRFNANTFPWLFNNKTKERHRDVLHMVI